MSEFKFQLKIDLTHFAEGLKSAQKMALSGIKNIEGILKGIKTDVDISEIESEMKRLNDLINEIDDIEIKADASDVENTADDIKDTDDKLRKKVEEPYIFKGSAKDLLAEFAKIGLAIDGVKKVAGMINSVAEPFEKYESGLKNLNTLINVSEKELSRYGDQIKELGKITGDIEQVNNGAWLAVSKLGKQVLDNSEFMNSMAKASVAGKASIEESISLTANIIKSMGLEISDSEKIMNQAFQTVKYGDTNFQELAHSIGGVSPIMNAAGGKLEELNALYATLTGVTGNTSEVTTQLKAALSNIIKPSESAKQTAKELGLEFSASAIKTMGFSKFLEQLKDKTSGNIETLGKLFESTEALNVITALTSSQYDTFNEKMKLIEDSAGAMTEAFDEQADSLEYKKKQLKASLEALAISLIEKLAPAITSIVSGLTDFTDIVEKNKGMFALLTVTIATYTVTTKLAMMATASTTAGMTAQGIVLAGLKAAWLKLNAVISANPVMAVVTAEVIAATIALSAWQKHLDKELELQQQLIDKTKEKASERAKELSNIEEYKKKMEDASQAELIAASKELTATRAKMNAIKEAELARLKSADASAEEMEKVKIFYDGIIQATHEQQKVLNELYEKAESQKAIEIKKDVSYEAWLEEIKQKQDEVFSAGASYLKTEVGIEVESASLEQLQTLLDNVSDENAKVLIQFEIDKRNGDIESELDQQRQAVASYIEEVKNMEEEGFQFKEQLIVNAIEQTKLGEDEKKALIEQSLNELEQLETQNTEKRLSDEASYYESVKFKDENYMNWKKQKIEEEVNQMAISEDKKQTIKAQKLGAMQMDYASFLAGEILSKESNNARLEQLDEQYFENLKNRYSAEIDAMELTDNEKLTKKQQFYNKVDEMAEKSKQKQISKYDELADFSKAMMDGMVSAMDEYLFNENMRKTSEIELDMQLNELNHQEKLRQIDEEIAKAKKGSVEEKKLRLEKQKLENQYAKQKKKLNKKLEMSEMSLAERTKEIMRAGIKEAIMMLAKKAMSYAYTSVMEIVPFPANLVAAPLAAATAYAGVSAFASGFEEGTSGRGIEEKDLITREQLKNSNIIIPANEDGIVAVQKNEKIVSNKRDIANDYIIDAINDGASHDKIVEMVKITHSNHSPGIQRKIQVFPQGFEVGTPVSDYLRRAGGGTPPVSLTLRGESTGDNKLLEEINQKLNKLEKLQEIKETIIEKEFSAVLEIDGEKVAETVTEYQEKESNRGIS